MKMVHLFQETLFTRTFTKSKNYDYFALMYVEIFKRLKSMMNEEGIVLPGRDSEMLLDMIALYYPKKKCLEVADRLGSPKEMIEEVMEVRGKTSIQCIKKLSASNKMILPMTIFCSRVLDDEEG